jgi:hypothetical protein
MEFCTRCRTTRNMRVSVSRRKLVESKVKVADITDVEIVVRVSVSRRELADSKENIEEIITKSYHCESCGSFVRSEDIIMN